MTFTMLEDGMPQLLFIEHDDCGDAECEEADHVTSRVVYEEEEATHVQRAYVAKHPADGHEFGLATMAAVPEEVYLKVFGRQQAHKALNEYFAAHPGGKEA